MQTHTKCNICCFEVHIRALIKGFHIRISLSTTKPNYRESTSKSVSVEIGIQPVYHVSLYRGKAWKEPLTTSYVITGNLPLMYIIALQLLT